MTILVVSPHPDDETLGCGGTLLKYNSENKKIVWLNVTALERNDNNHEIIENRKKEIELVSEYYGFSKVFNLELPTTKLDAIPTRVLIDQIGQVVQEVKPKSIYIPFQGDVHSDHRLVAEACMAICKWFRHGTIREVIAYEILSETDFGLSPIYSPFKPNLFVDISEFLEPKISIMKIYASEMGEFPFPRSEEAIRNLAALRGATAGCIAAEAFMILKLIR